MPMQRYNPMDDCDQVKEMRARDEMRMNPYALDRRIEALNKRLDTMDQTLADLGKNIGLLKEKVDELLGKRTTQPVTGNRARGLVKWFNDVKGFGFTEEINGQSVFIHRSSFADGLTTLAEGDVITFEYEVRQKGPVALRVRKG